MIGTIAYAALVTGCMGLLLFWGSRRRVSAWLAWPLGLAFCWGVELWQLTGVPAQLSSQWIGWRLALGTTFDWRDVALYPVGVALAALTLWAVPTLRPAPAGRVRETVRQLFSGVAVIAFWSALVAWFWWHALSWHAFWGQPGSYDDDSGTVVPEVAEQMQTLLRHAQLTEAAIGGLCLAAVVLFFATRPATPDVEGSAPGSRRSLLLGIGALAPVLATWLLSGSVVGWWGFWVPVLGAISHATLVARVSSARRPSGRAAWWRGVAAVAGTIFVLIFVATLGFVAGGLLAWLSNSTHRAVQWISFPVQLVMMSAAAAWAGYAWTRWSLARPAPGPDDGVEANGLPAPFLAPTPTPTTAPTPAPDAAAAGEQQPAGRGLSARLFCLVLPLAVCSALLAAQGAGEAIASRETFDRLGSVDTLPPVYPSSPTPATTAPTIPEAKVAPATPSSAKRACTASDLRFELVGIGRVLGGNGFGSLQAVNRSADACWVQGRPTLGITQAGRPLAITSGRPETQAPDGDGSRVSLAPGQRAEAVLGWRGYGATDRAQTEQQVLTVALGSGSLAVPAVTALAVDDGYTPPPQASLHLFDLIDGGHLGVSTWGTVGQYRQ